MERRLFLLGSSLALRSAFGANEQVNVAIVGVGSRGNAHLKEYLLQDGARIGAVCDVNQAQTERAVAMVEKAKGYKPKVYEDMRKLYADKEIDAVSIATPNHWHSLATIWACEAGKDVYCEKPASYNIWEGQRMEAAARKHNRIVQVGMQSRSIPHKIRAVELLRHGAIGKLYMAKGVCYKRRPSIGHEPDTSTPAGVNWDLFLGPAPMRSYNKLRHVYNWHWFWDTGNGDIGNQGIHEMDVARWGLGVGLPKGVSSTGGKFAYNDDQETPNTQIASFDYGDKEIQFEVRGLNTGTESGIAPQGPHTIGDVFFGDKGYMVVDHSGFQIFLGDKKEPGESMKAASGSDTGWHMKNFLDAVKSRKKEDLHGEVAEGVASAVLVHMANTSYRLGRKLAFDPLKQSFTGDEEANKMKTRHPYRTPYVVA